MGLGKFMFRFRGLGVDVGRFMPGKPARVELQSGGELGRVDYREVDFSL